MPTLLFTCPITRMKVQHWLDSDEDTSANEFEAIERVWAVISEDRRRAVLTLLNGKMP